MYFYKIATPKLTAEGLTFAAFLTADSKAQAERYTREQPRFRKTARQNGLDWRTVPVMVTRVAMKSGKAR